MKNYSRIDILKLAKDNDVRYVRLQFTDMLGVVKKRRNSSNKSRKSSRK